MIIRDVSGHIMCVLRKMNEGNLRNSAAYLLKLVIDQVLNPIINETGMLLSRLRHKELCVSLDLLPELAIYSN